MNMTPDLNVPPAIYAVFTPSGKLRASINLGNPILASLDASSRPAGVSVDLATEFAKLLGAELELVVFDAAGKSVQALLAQQADIGFFAIDPVRGARLAFTAPYVLIEGFYLVRQDSPIRSNAQVDDPGNRVVVGKGSAYDLFLTRTLTQAEIVRAPTSPTVVDTFLQGNAQVAAGVKQQLELDAARASSAGVKTRLLDQRFMLIEQAMGVLKSRGKEASAFLGAFLERMKSSGFVAAALERHNIKGAAVAPAAE